MNTPQHQEAEPAAWRAANARPPGGYVIFQQYPQALADLGREIEPLYTHPPQHRVVDPSTSRREFYQKGYSHGRQELIATLNHIIGTDDLRWSRYDELLSCLDEIKLELAIK
jgi:hypothetical protein